jgi:hypothetical protein
MPGAIRFYTTADGASSITERMVIESTGYVGIGTASPTYQFQVSTDSAGKPTTNTWTVTSDQRIKENIVNADLNRCLEIVNSIPLRHYRWKDSAYSDEQIKDRNSLGFIAQEVAPVFPKAVNVKKFEMNDGTIIDDCLDLQVDQLYKVMWGAIQNLSNKNAQLESEIAAIKTHLGL